MIDVQSLIPSAIRFMDSQLSQDETTDWKIIGINVNDPLSKVVESKAFLQLLASTRD
jgi:hypothetical protein